MYIKLQDIFNELHNDNILQHTAMLSQLDYTCSANLLEILAEAVNVNCVVTCSGFSCEDLAKSQHRSV